MSFNITKRASLPVIAALVALGMMVVAQSAMAAHVRPNAATPFSVSMAVAYDECGGTSGNAPNSTHDPSFIAGLSCVPPTKSSTFITHGNPPTTPANMKGRAHLVVSETPSYTTVTFVPAPVPASGLHPATGSDTFIQDVRCGAGLGAGHPACVPSPNAAGGADYLGFLVASAFIRITDHQSGGAGGTLVGTVEDNLFPVPMRCSPTPTTVGAFCRPSVSDAQALCTCINQVNNVARANIEIDQVVMSDGNVDANPFSTGEGVNTDVARQGIFIP